MTPLVRLNKIPQSEGVECEILVKLEYFNPGGSYKDRAAERMIRDAEKSGRIKKGSNKLKLIKFYKYFEINLKESKI